MNDLRERLKDWKTTVPGGAAITWVVMRILNRYNISLDVSPQTVEDIVFALLGIGLMLSGGHGKKS
jgi:hypothetical protein